MRRKNKRKGFFGITSRAMMSVAAFLLILSYLSIFVNPAKAWFMTIFGLLFIPLLLLNLFLMLWAIARRSGAVLIPFIALVPSCFLIGRYVQFGAKKDDPGELTIVSYNVGRFASSAPEAGIKDREACEDSVLKLLKETDADIICLQEFYLKDASRVGNYLARRFKGYNVEYFVYPQQNGCYGNVTLSRFPIIARSKLDFEESSNLAISCDIDIDGTPLRLYNCHFQSYSLSLSYIAEKIRGDYREAVRYTEGKMRKSLSLRPRQVDMVMENIEASPLESFVIGDFNDSPMSYTYNRLSKGRIDSFVQAGKGTGATYSSSHPMLRIDYVLFPGQFKAVLHKVIDKAFSDHRPVLVKLKKEK